MLTTKQRAYLRALANGIEPIFQVGKGGVTPVLAQQVADALKAREIIKVSVLKTCDQSVKEVCGALADMTGAEQVQCIGRRLVLYKESEEHKSIVLEK